MEIHKIELVPIRLHAYTFVGRVVSLLDVPVVRLRRFLLAASVYF
jgi:hypothetical protein